MDQYHGQGGTYILDPITGERKLVERTYPPAPDLEPTQLERRRARTRRGHFVGDDLATPDTNEAWQ